MNPFTHPDAFKLIFGGRRWLGTYKISGHDRAKNWDVKKAKGQSGASSSLVGDDIGEFDILFEWSDDPNLGVDLDVEWSAMQALWESTVSGTKPKALPIYDPDLAANHFTAVSLKSMGGIVRDDRGGATCKVRAIEYRPPKPKPAAKASSKAAPGRTARPDPNAARKAQLGQLKEQAKEV